MEGFFNLKIFCFYSLWIQFVDLQPIVIISKSVAPLLASVIVKLKTSC